MRVARCHEFNACGFGREVLSVSAERAFAVAGVSRRKSSRAGRYPAFAAKVHSVELDVMP
jgi:hypothetical protein